MKYRLILVLAAAAMLSAGCSKETGLSGGDAPLNFSTVIPEIEEVKASPVTSITTFSVKGFTGSEQWFPKTGSPVEVTLSDGTATYSDYIWRGDKKTFYAYSNLPNSGASASITSSGVTLTYSALPTTAEGQTDVLLGRYDGNGDGTGTAAMTFYHPLAQVVLKIGSMDEVANITNVTVGGIYSGGSTTLGKTGTGFSWTGTSAKTNISRAVSIASPVEGTAVGVPMMLIPQTFTNADPVTIQLTATVEGVQKTLSATLNSGAFVAGKMNVVTMNYSAGSPLNFTTSVENWANTTIEQEAAEAPIKISSYDDLIDFKAMVEEGTNLKGRVVEFTNDIIATTENFIGIYDEYGVLDNVVFDGKNHTLEFNLDYEEGFGYGYVRQGLFYDLKSSNVVFKDLTCKFTVLQSASYASFGCIAATFSGNNLLISHCNFIDCGTTIDSGTHNNYTGIIGIAEGNITMTDIVIDHMTSKVPFCGSAMVGCAIGNIQLNYTLCEVKNCDFGQPFTDLSNYEYFGFLLGNIQGSDNIEININDISVTNNKGPYGRQRFRSNGYYQYDWVNNTFTDPFASRLPSATTSILIGSTIPTATITLSGWKCEEGNELFGPMEPDEPF